MSDEIRRRKTSDPEMDAIQVIAQAMAPLDRPAAKRVVSWAEERYVNPAPPLSSESQESVAKFMRAVAETAQEIGLMPPIDLLRAMSRVADEAKAQEPSEVPE